MNGRSIRNIFPRFQNVPASCESNLPENRLVEIGLKTLRDLVGAKKAIIELHLSVLANTPWTFVFSLKQKEMNG